MIYVQDMMLRVLHYIFNALTNSLATYGALQILLTYFIKSFNIGASLLYVKEVNGMQ